MLCAARESHASLAAARDWLPRLGLDGLADRLPGELSGGQGQRVAVARALIAGPRVVFADEPTGALDSVAADQVMDVLTDEVKAQGGCMVIVTHEPRVAAYADRTVIVRDGVVVDPETLKQVQGQVDQVNKSLASFEQVKKFTVIDREFSIADGEMTPTTPFGRRISSARVSPGIRPSRRRSRTADGPRAAV